MIEIFNLRWVGPSQTNIKKNDGLAPATHNQSFGSRQKYQPKFHGFSRKHVTILFLDLAAAKSGDMKINHLSIADQQTKFIMCFLETP
jgi:hypothetical protein